MCKVLGIAGLDKKHDKAAWNFIRSAAKEMVKADKDGYGYAALSHDGDLFGEKWQNPAHRFRLRKDISKHIADYRRAFGDFVDLPSGYMYMGEVDGWRSGPAAIIAHSRMATCGRQIENVHPFMKDGIAVIHNGIITNTEDHKKSLSTCDSESILSLYLEEGIKDRPEKFQRVASEIEGSYAAIVLHDKGMDVFRNSGSHLEVSRVKRLNAWAFATTKGIIKQGAKAIKSKTGPCVEVNPGSFMRLDPFTGEVIFKATFKEKESPVLSRWHNYGGALTQFPEAATEAKETPLEEFSEREKDLELRLGRSAFETGYALAEGE